MREQVRTPAPNVSRESRTADGVRRRCVDYQPAPMPSKFWLRLAGTLSYPSPTLRSHAFERKQLAVSSSWQDDPFAFDDLFDERFDEEDTGGPSPKKGKRRLADRGVLALCLVALVGAVSAFAMGASEAGWPTVAVGALAYLAAAAGDLRQRSIRHRHLRPTAFGRFGAPPARAPAAPPAVSS